jgi:hypothetical protein
MLWRGKLTTRRFALAALAASILLPTLLFGAPAAHHSKLIALVLQHAAAPEAVASDAKTKAHLESLGYTVRVVDHLAPASETAGADAILISATVSSNKIGGKYRNSTIPILTWEPYMLSHLGMTGRKENVDFGTKERERWLWVVNAPHAATGGLPAGQVNAQQKNVPMGWGKPGLGASILATFPGEDEKAAAFVYEKGATMDYENIAPARRAFVFVDTAAFADMNEDGLKIFDAVVAWVVAGGAGAAT